jgi:hypothetical protein
LLFAAVCVHNEKILLPLIGRTAAFGITLRDISVAAEHDGTTVE